MAAVSGNRTGAQGFTLIELMVVVIVLGIVTATVVSQFGASRHEEILRSEARELLAVMNLAYSEAVTSSRLHRLRLDPGKGRYWLEARSGEEVAFSPLRNVAGASGTIDVRLSAAVRESTEREDQGEKILFNLQATPTPSDAIDFRPDGTADAREVELRDQQGFALLLLVNPLTSRVDIVEVTGGDE